VAAVAGWRDVFDQHLQKSLQWLPVCFSVVLACAAGVVDALVPVRTPVPVPAGARTSRPAPHPHEIAGGSGVDRNAT
jgi:hypothetical protein